MNFLSIKKLTVFAGIMSGIFLGACTIYAQDAIAVSPEVTLNSINLVESAPEAPAAPAVPDPEMSVPPAEVQMTSEEILRLAREASFQNDLVKVTELVDQCVQFFGGQAKNQQSSLSAFPPRGEEGKYQALNDVATCLFTKGETLMYQGKPDEAIVIFKKIIEEYKWAQAWDPRGWFWSVAEKSQDSIDVLTGKEAEEVIETAVRTLPHLEKPGKEKVVDYEKYGKFNNIGTKDYKYEITDYKGLSDAVGEGIYPNSTPVFKNGRYQELSKNGRLKKSHWDFVNSDDLEVAYYKWFTAPEPWGVKLFYIGMIFEKAKMYHEALKAYRALIVHFPDAVAWTYWQTPWYPAQAAIAKIKHIIRIHPELNLDAKGMRIEIKNAFDNDVKNDIVITHPGVLQEKSLITKAKEKVKSKQVKFGKVQKQVGEGKVQLVQYENGHWQLMVDGKPYIIKGMTYAPTRVGQSPDKNTLANWMQEDTNKNDFLDGPYEAWVDKNGNNVQDEDELNVGDFQLMKEMGVNTIRRYHQPFEADKKVLRDLYERYGIRIIMGDYLGKYAIGSGASWFEGTDYENPEHKKKMLESVQKMVMDYKDEPYILMWLLGNENNYGVACNADKKPAAYYAFVNEVAQWIKSVDKDHPVSISNGDTLFLDIFAQNAPDVDIFAANVYRGDYGFGSFWEQVFDATGKPAYITEYGAPAFAKHLTLEEAEQAQADYHIGNWLDIAENSAGRADGAGNALGGVVFEWLDEWWKNYEPYRHDKKSDAIGPFPGGYYFEEWFGIIGQGNGQNSPFLRHLRKSYFAYKEMWE